MASVVKRSRRTADGDIRVTWVAWYIDQSGKRYLDFLSGIGVNALGYNHPTIVDTIARQSRALIHTSNLFYHEGQAELAMRLTERAGLDRAFFANTGTEAWEGALKLARAYAGLRRSEGAHIGTRRFFIRVYEPDPAAR